MRVPPVRPCAHWSWACLGALVLALAGCSGDDGPTSADLPKNDTVWFRVSTDGIATVVTVHASLLDAETGDRPAGVASCPVSDFEPTLFEFRNVDAFDPNVTGWLLRIDEAPIASGLCAQTLPTAGTPLTLCTELEPISPR